MQALWQVYITLSREINHLHYEVARANAQHQFGLIYVTHYVFVGNTYKDKLTCADVASIYKVLRALSTNRASEVAFVLEAVNMTKLLEKNNFDIQRTTIKHKHTRAVLVEAFQ